MRGVDAAFGDAVRELLVGLAAGSEPSASTGGGLARVLRETAAATTRSALDDLIDRWSRAPPLLPEMLEPLLHRPDLGESEKLHATLRELVVRQCSWQELSSNESTFYRDRRAAL